MQDIGIEPLREATIWPDPDPFEKGRERGLAIRDRQFMQVDAEESPGRTRLLSPGGIDHPLAPLLQSRENIRRAERLGDEGCGDVTAIAHHVNHDGVREEREHSVGGPGVRRGRVDPTGLALATSLGIRPLPRGHDRLSEMP